MSLLNDQLCVSGTRDIHDTVVG